MSKKLQQLLVTAFRPHNEGLEKLFGSLESEIMDLIWEQREASARDIFEALRDRGQRLSYGAVKTVLDRLVKKQVLMRTMVNNQYLYAAHLSREEFTHTAVGEIVSSLLKSFGDPAMAQFLSQMRDVDPEQLKQLSNLIDEAEATKPPPNS